MRIGIHPIAVRVVRVIVKPGSIARHHLLEEALATAEAAQDEQGVAVALQLLGTPARGRGDLARAEILYEQACAINRQLDSRV